MKTECDCGKTLEFLAATQPKSTNTNLTQYSYETERRIFYACDACKNIYEVMETARSYRTGQTVTCEMAPYLGDLCRGELEKYAGTKSGMITMQDELDIVSQFARDLREK